MLRFCNPYQFFLINKKIPTYFVKATSYRWASLERMPRDWAKLCLTVKLPYSQYRNNYKISQGSASYMPYRRACLNSGCFLAVLHCVWKTCKWLRSCRSPNKRMRLRACVLMSFLPKIQKKSFKAHVTKCHKIFWPSKDERTTAFSKVVIKLPRGIQRSVTRFYLPILLTIKRSWTDAHTQR